MKVADSASEQHHSGANHGERNEQPPAATALERKQPKTYLHTTAV